MRVQQWYRSNAGDSASDIAPHFPYLLALVRSVNASTIIELGIREGHSSSAFLMGMLLRGGGQLFSVDVEPPAVVPLSGAAFRAIAWYTLVADDLSPAAQAWLPETCDMLFIDTSHAYDHTLAELKLYGPRVRQGGVIVLHDTANEHPEIHDPSIPPQEPFPVLRAVEKYCADRMLAFENTDLSWGLATIFV